VCSTEADYSHSCQSRGYKGCFEQNEKAFEISGLKELQNMDSAQLNIQQRKQCLRIDQIRKVIK